MRNLRIFTRRTAKHATAKVLEKGGESLYVCRLEALIEHYFRPVLYVSCNATIGHQVELSGSLINDNYAEARKRIAELPGLAVVVEPI